VAVADASNFLVANISKAAGPASQHLVFVIESSGTCSTARGFQPGSLLMSKRAPASIFSAQAT
jgi:hypothetical protein